MAKEWILNSAMNRFQYTSHDGVTFIIAIVKIDDYAYLVPYAQEGIPCQRHESEHRGRYFSKTGVFYLSGISPYAQ